MAYVYAPSDHAALTCRIYHITSTSLIITVNEFYEFGYSIAVEIMYIDLPIG